jgi:predicted glutamine amidotransferase
MCRLYGFRSSIRSRVHHSLIQAENALARQSERHSDGWGISYYVGRYPHLIRNDQQAQGDALFKHLSGVVSTRAVIAHIRLATVGDARVLNCHPFQHGCWAFAHNGEVAGFDRPEVRQRLLMLIDERFRHYVLGETDSELIFHLFLAQLARLTEHIHGEGVTLEQVLDALRVTTRLILAAAPDDQAPPDKHNKLTFLLSNGDMLVGYRHRRDLHYSTYKRECPESESCAAYDPRLCENEVKYGMVKHLIVTSEPVGEGPNVWIPLEDDEYVAVRHGMMFQRGRLNDGRREY